MNCIKLLLSYLNYKLHLRIKKIEIERLKEVRLIRSRLQKKKQVKSQCKVKLKHKFFSIKIFFSIFILKIEILGFPGRLHQWRCHSNNTVLSLVKPYYCCYNVQPLARQEGYKESGLTLNGQMTRVKAGIDPPRLSGTRMLISYSSADFIGKGEG